MIRTREICEDHFEAALRAGRSSVEARVIAGRRLDAPIDVDREVPVDDPSGLPDLESAVSRIVLAVEAGEAVAVETDYDVDGVTSHAVLVTALKRLGHARTVSIIGHRLREGYGLSQSVAERIAASEPRPTLVVTADNGSSDEERIAWLKGHGIDTVVTDHHELPEQEVPGGASEKVAPRSAVACVNPAAPTSTYPDRRVAGCMVAWLLMVAVARRLAERGRDVDPDLGPLLDFVALGTVADCVSLASPINRTVVRSGLALINNGARPCWRVLMQRLKTPFTSETIAYQIGPRLNAKGRLDDAMFGARFLLSADEAEAGRLAERLDQDNAARKEVEQAMTSRAVAIGEEQVDAGAVAVIVWLPDGHPGVHGIVASRLVERFGCPSVCLSPSAENPDWVAGSARTAARVHVRDALQAVATAHPGLLVKFGGHEGAGGLTIRREDIERFTVAYETACRVQTGSSKPEPLVLSDGVLKAHVMNLETVHRLAALSPYGTGFEVPLFHGMFKVGRCRLIGGNRHLRMTLIKDGRAFQAVWFSPTSGPMAEEGPYPVSPGDTVTVAYQLSINDYFEEPSLQLLVRAVER